MKVKEGVRKSKGERGGGEGGGRPDDACQDKAGGRGEEGGRSVVSSAYIEGD